MNVDQLFGKRKLETDIEDQRGHAKVLNFLDPNELEILELLKHDNEDQHHEIETFDQKWLNRSLDQLNKAILENFKMREKYKNDPEKFLDSEFELNESIKVLSGLSLTDDNLLIASFCQNNISLELISMMKTHPNIDVSNQLVKILNEVLTSNDDEEELDETIEHNFSYLFKKSKFPFLLCDHIIKLDKQISEVLVKETVKLELTEHLSIALNLLIKLVEFPDLNKFFIDDKKLINFVIRKLNISQIGVVDDILGSYSEFIFTLISTTANVKISRLTKMLETFNMVEVLLINFSLFTHAKQIEPEQQEYIENLVDCLCFSLRISSLAKRQFNENEGLELLFLIFEKERENNWAISQSLKILHNTINWNDEFSQTIASSIISKGGLKYIFRYLKAKQAKSTVAIIGSLFRLLDLESNERIRLLNKLLDKDAHNFKKLLKLRENYLNKIRTVEDELIKIDLGLDVLQMIDIIITWCLIEEHVGDEFSRLVPIKIQQEVEINLKEQIENLKEALFESLEDKESGSENLTEITKVSAQDSLDLLSVLISRFSARKTDVNVK